MLGVAVMIVCRRFLDCIWWEALLPLVLSAGVPGYIRVYWPRKDLPEVVHNPEPPLLDQKKKDRRERKRNRQPAALRRSQRR